MKNVNLKKGFTLVEIMIVVLIIGILLAIAVPNFAKARTTSRAKTCIANLKQIEGAKEQWAIETNQAPTAAPVQADLQPNYIKTWPPCPDSGTYTIGDLVTRPSCSFGGTHVLP